MISVSSWVEEMEMLEYSPVLLFKQQGEMPFEACEGLEPNDFLLVIQTEFQRDMLCAHVCKGVCIDTTYKINDYEFNLITVMILDDFQEGVPVLWALSSREDKVALIRVFEALKEKCGNLQTDWFMSDMATQFFGAWDCVFEAEKTNYIWCTWHVDRAWKEGLKRHVTNKSQQVDLYHHLKVMMMETNRAQFRQLLSQFLTLSKSIAPSFTHYFQSTYCNHVEQWATCYRLGTPMNTNMFIHRVLKIVYLQHKQNRRVDHLLYILLKISRDKAFEQLCKMEKGKTTHRICDINKRHKTALTLLPLAIIEDAGDNCYRITSQSRPGITYNVVVNLSECLCKLKCRFCDACAHMYTCTCLDACINTTVCKHMHLIHMQKPQEGSNPSNTDRSDKLEYFRRVTAPEMGTNIPTVQQYMEKINKRAANILVMCNSCKDTATLENIYQHLGLAMDELSGTKSLLKRKASNEHSKTQPRYYSTHKKRKIATQSVSKPTDHEVTSSQMKLTNTETEICGICFMEDDKGSGVVDWISCTNCMMWVHKICAGNALSPNYKC